MNLSSRRAGMLLLLALIYTPLHAQQKPFYLHDGDTVVFYGDSITEQRYYTSVIELYTQTRFPTMHVRFFNSGIGGDRVSGGFAGPIDERLERDVFAHQPTVITIMLGMNDGGYQPLTDQIAATYTQGYEHILQSIRQHVPNARITLLGPSPFDEVTRPDSVPGGYNNALKRMLEIDQTLAKKYDALYIDLNAPVVAALQRGKQIDNLATEMIIPDRVHPGMAVHWIMAAAALEGWNAPALVASTDVDAAGSQSTGSENTAITGLSKAGDTLRWTEDDRALPLALDTKVADTAFLLQISDIEQRLNQEPLKVTGLAPGSYTLRIDGKPQGNFTAEQLATGLNLAELNTPMRQQSQSVGWEIRDYEDTEFVHLRLLVRDKDNNLPSVAGSAELTKFEDLERKMIYDAAQQKAHVFELAQEGGAGR